MTIVVTTKKTYIDPKELPPVERAQVRRIAASLRPYRAQALLVLALVTASATLNLLPPLFVKAVIDFLEAVIDHARPPDLSHLALLCVGMVVGPLIAGLLGVGQRYYTTAIGERVMFDLRQQLYEHLNRQSLRYFIQSRPGVILSSVLNDVQGVGSVVSTTLVAAVENTIVFVATAALIVYLDWRLALLALGVLPLFVIPTRRAGRRRKQLRRASQAALAELTGILAETLSISGAALMRIFGAERFEAERLRAKGRELIDLSLKQTLAGRWFQMLMGLFETIGPALVFGAGGYFVLSGRTHSLGNLVAITTALKRLYSPASSLASLHVDAVTSYAYFERVFKVLDVQPLIQDVGDARVLSQVGGRIQFEGVGISFPDGDVLSDIDLTIEPGQCVALVGPSGAGKTSLARLVPRLSDPSRGRVLLDGIDLRAIELRSLRSHVAIVTQETYLFHASVLDNLRYARPQASLDEVSAACRAARIDAVIEALPQGYDTVVGERGHRLSGGERQRLAIARAILKDARILILDEATSSLDAVSEALVQRALESLLRGRTSLLIAHRLSTVRIADRIVVMQRGRIQEIGTHEELLSRSGLYSELRRATQRGADLAP